MTIKPLTQWQCDVCKENIKATRDGYVTWTDDDESRPYGFKIIHQQKCDDNQAHSSAALGDFLGADGLAKLLAFLSYGPLKSGTPAGPKNMNDFVDFVRRLQTPFYEEARQKFFDRDVREARSDWNEILPYMQAELQILAEHGK